MQYIDPAQLRKEFSYTLSAMYAAEVPLYGELIETVKQVNLDYVKAHPELAIAEEDVAHLSEERHGAIRLGKPEELRNIARFFALLGMEPVNFYDLTSAGDKSQPVISTAFRPLTLEEIEVSPFRVFCSLLQPDDERFFDEPELREQIKGQLAPRQIFSDTLLELIAQGEAQGKLTEKQAESFLQEGAELFKWQGKAKAHDLYQSLMEKKLNIAADIVCFPNPHLNHLTPNVMDIDALQKRMAGILEEKYQELGAKMKDHIEGPPARDVLILLRQTSYLALTEVVVFTGDENVDGAHTARFGEIEQRGVALTPEGRKRYDAALDELEHLRAEGETITKEITDKVFSILPDNYDALRKEGLAYYTYHLAGEAPQEIQGDLEQWIEQGFVRAKPIRYEDFLPVSAAGIFASNLKVSGAKHQGESPYSKEDLEVIMDKKILDSQELCATQQVQSLSTLYKQLGIQLP